MVKKRMIEVEQYVDSDEPITLTCIPSGRGGFLLVSEDPVDYTVRFVTDKEKEYLVSKWGKIHGNQNGEIENCDSARSSPG